MTSNNNLKGKTIIVTGALGKLGKHICASLAESEAIVLALARFNNKEKKEIESIKLVSNLYDCDVSDEKQFLSILKEIQDQYKVIDGLVTSTSYRPMKLGLDDSIENWIDSISKNSTAIYLPCKAIGKIMCAQKLGSIVNISSIYGLGAPLKSLYKGTNLLTEPDYPFLKGGTIALTKYLASLYGEHNVRVNAIASGGIYNNQPEQFLSNYSQRVPLGRMGSEKDIANLIKYLLADESSYISGSVIPVDGGWSAT